MKSKTSRYISSAVCSALSFAVAHGASAETKDYYDEKSNHCFGAAKAGENGCASKEDKHACTGTSKLDCSWNDWTITRTRENCEELMQKNCPENWESIRSK